MSTCRMRRSGSGVMICPAVRRSRGPASWTENPEAIRSRRRPPGAHREPARPFPFLRARAAGGSRKVRGGLRALSSLGSQAGAILRPELAAEHFESHCFDDRIGARRPAYGSAVYSIQPFDYLLASGQTDVGIETPNAAGQDSHLQYAASSRAAFSTSSSEGRKVSSSGGE